MEHIIDLAIVGAGPAGLIAAKTAAELGLETTVIEMKRDITNVKRACSAQFVMDKGYENETVEIVDNKIHFINNGFYVNYTGPLLNIIDNYHHSPSGHTIHLAHKDHKPFAVKFDKGHLLKDLSQACEKAGAKLVFNTIALNGHSMGDYMKLDIKTGKVVSHICCRKLIIAEGANAALAGKLGFNKDRTLYGRPFVFSCVMEGTTGFEPQSWNQFYSRKYHPFAEVMVESSITGPNDIELTIMGTKNMRPDILFDKLIHESPLSSHFTNSKIKEKRGCSVSSYESLKKPYNDNVLVIGDTAAHVEVIVQGALMCGYNAAKAVYDELHNKNGFKEYTSWWNKAFDFNRMNSLEFVQLYGALSMMPKYTDAELDYLFSLVENEVLCGNYSQFEVPKTVWKAILGHKASIEKENPKLFAKIQPIIELDSHGKL